ncbi:hypothetical protein Golax_020289 [Gossypium laxum]|uniref:Uncharacterized protein n=1 Tax=Gossypium laxum TaxID=34288 RepID=A0A7J9B0M2_9ROSI|nr:hypothetical protein [Gossypium laxum]
MDGSKKVMESFDYLWFFNNVLTLTPLHHKLNPPPTAPSVDVDTADEQKPPKPDILLHEAAAPVPGSEIPVPRCPNCGEIAVVTDQQRVVQPFAKATEKPAERRKRRRRRRKRSKRKVLGELDLGFYGNLDSESSFSEGTYGYKSFDSRHYIMKMPPSNDGFAMKEHLKSWAYAVACTFSSNRCCHEVAETGSYLVVSVRPNHLANLEDYESLLGTRVHFLSGGAMARDIGSAFVGGVIRHPVGN